MGEYTGAPLVGHLKDLLDRFELRKVRLFGITIENASSNSSMSRELQSTLGASGID
jgi:hypothetical protein